MIKNYLNQIIQGDCLEVMKNITENFIDCCITSPPYWGLRDYGVVGQLGLEKTPEEYINKMIDIFREVKRALKKEGTCWLILADTYNGLKVGNTNGVYANGVKDKSKVYAKSDSFKKLPSLLLKPKNLIGIPWRVAFALQASGWYLRQDIVWHKPNPMPESVKDRCTKAHEYIFLLTKSSKYYFDNKAILEPAKYDGRKDTKYKGGAKDVSIGAHERWPNKLKNTNYGKDGKGFCGHSGSHYYKQGKLLMNIDENGIPARNKRSVWTVNTKPFKEAHFATFPEALIEPMIKAGAPEGGIVLDVFMGAGTTAITARKLNRNFIGIELNPEYVEMAKKRIESVESVESVVTV